MLIKGGISKDDRGSVTFVNDFDLKGVKRFYMVENNGTGFRGWHGHKKESKWVFVATGTAIVGVAELDTDKVEWFVLKDSDPQILYIPPGHANGFKTWEPGVRVIFYSDKTLEESKEDDYRFPPDQWKGGNWG